MFLKYVINVGISLFETATENIYIFVIRFISCLYINEKK